ncbi:hypothetical protein BX666DRAFT_2116515 [Dichotomocladium elegans]|nr:hypothetical protein BX666DRAFT_2116515 [Dichotomocladium elegans]
MASLYISQSLLPHLTRTFVRLKEKAANSGRLAAAERYQTRHAVLFSCHPSPFLCSKAGNWPLASSPQCKNKMGEWRERGVGIGLITITFTASTAIAFRFVDLEAVFGERQIIHPIQHPSFEIDLFTAFIIVVHVIAIVIVIVLTHRTGLGISYVCLLMRLYFVEFLIWIIALFSKWTTSLTHTISMKI